MAGPVSVGFEISPPPASKCDIQFLARVVYKNDGLMYWVDLDFGGSASTTVRSSRAQVFVSAGNTVDSQTLVPPASGVLYENLSFAVGPAKRPVVVRASFANVQPITDATEAGRDPALGLGESLLVRSLCNTAVPLQNVTFSREVILVDQQVRGGGVSAGAAAGAAGASLTLHQSVATTIKSPSALFAYLNVQGAGVILAESPSGLKPYPLRPLSGDSLLGARGDWRLSVIHAGAGPGSLYAMLAGVAPVARLEDLSGTGLALAP